VRAPPGAALVEPGAALSCSPTRSAATKSNEQFLKRDRKAPSGG